MHISRTTYPTPVHRNRQPFPPDEPASFESKLQEGAKGLIPLYGALSTLESGQGNATKYMFRSMNTTGPWRTEMARKSSVAGNLGLAGFLTNIGGTVTLMAAAAAQSPGLGVLGGSLLVCSAGVGFANGKL